MEMILYKYFPWDTNNTEQKNFTKKNLENSQLYFNNANSFNDPFELSPIYNTEGTFSEKIKFLTSSYKYQEKLSTRRAKSKAYDFLTKNNLIDAPANSSIISYYYENLKDKTGISCFAQCYKNLLMWAHYANFHKGICMKFKFDNLKKNLSFSKNHPIYSEIFFRKVVYENQRISFSIFKEPTGENFPQFLTQKSFDWAYEEEYRAFIIGYTGLINYEPQNISLIYLGCRMSNENVEEIKNIFKNREHRPNLYKMELDKCEFKLNPIPINY